MGLRLTDLILASSAYGASDLTDLIREVLADRRPTPAKYVINVGAWEPVLQTALAYRPDARFPNAGQLLAALEATLPQAVGAAGPAALAGGVWFSSTGPRGAGGPMAFRPSSPHPPCTSPHASS